MTFEDVAKRAGVSRGALLHYFSQKSELALAVLEDGTRELLRDLRARLPEWQNHADRDGLIFDEIYYGGRLFQAFLAVQVHARTDPVLDEQLRRIVKQAVEGIGDIVAEGWGGNLTEREEWPLYLWLFNDVIRGIALSDSARKGAGIQSEVWVAARRLLLGALGDLRAGRSLTGPPTVD